MENNLKKRYRFNYCHMHGSGNCYFIRMMKLKDLSVVKKIIIPILAIIGSVFMILAAIYSHKLGVLYFIIVTSIIMLIGSKYEKKYKLPYEENKYEI